MKKYLLHIVIFLCSIQQFHAQDDGVVALNILARTSLKFNRSFINPTFSFVREGHKYASFTTKREWVGFEDAPHTYLFGYTGRFAESYGAGLSLFQQNYGVLTTFGGVANFAYNVVVNRSGNLTFAMNLGFYKSGVNSGNVVVNTPDPSLDNIPSNSIITVNPAINYGTEFFDFGASLNNIVAFNLTSSGMVEDNPEQTIQVHVMYTGYVYARGFFEDSKFSGLINSEFKKDQTIFSGTAMLTIPKGLWGQVGYNSFYGISAGIGLNISSQIALEYNYEKAVGDISSFGNSHDITLAYKFTSKERYDYFGDDRENGLIIPDKKNNRRKKVTKSATPKDLPRKSEVLAQQRAAEAAAAAALEAERRASQVAGLQGKSEADRLEEKEAADRAAAAAQIVADQKAQELAEEERLRNEEAARIAEAARLEEEKAAAEKLKADQEARRLANARRLEAEAEAQRLADAKRLEEEQLALAEAERLRKEEAARLAAAAQLKADEEAQRLAEAKRLEEEQAALAEAERLRKEEAARLAAAAQLKADEEAQRLAEAKRLEEEEARLAAAAQLKADEEAQRLAEAKRLEEEQAALAEAERLRKEEAAKLAAAKEAEEVKAVMPTDATTRLMNDMARSADATSKEQQDLINKLKEKVTNKQQDLDDLVEENNLSEQGIVSAPKPFKSIADENRELENLTSEIDKIVQSQNTTIRKLDQVYKERLQDVPDLNDETNRFYQRKLSELKAEQVQTLKIRQSAVIEIDQIKAEIKEERKRRIKRAVYDNDAERFKKDKNALNVIRQTTPLSSVPLTAADFDYGEELSNIQIIKGISNVEEGFYLVVAVHSNVDKRDEFLKKAVASGQKDINFFFDVNTNKYYIYYEKYNNIGAAQSALKTKGDKPFNGKTSLVKIEK